MGRQLYVSFVVTFFVICLAILDTSINLSHNFKERDSKTIKIEFLSISEGILDVIKFYEFFDMLNEGLSSSGVRNVIL